MFVDSIGGSDAREKLVERTALAAMGVLFVSTPLMAYAPAWRWLMPCLLVLSAGAFFLSGQRRVGRDLARWSAHRYELHPSFSSRLGKYYVEVETDARALLEREGQIWKLDRTGVPRIEVPGQGLIYHPVSICEHALILFGLLCDSEDREHRARFLLSADWLCEHLTLRGDPGAPFGVWEYPFSLAYVKAPWISAMAQGEALSVLVRAFQLTQAEKYLAAAKLALAAFYHDCSDGGATSTDASGNPVFEEFPTYPPSHVLNGWIFAALGVLDYHRATGDEGARELFERTLTALEQHLPRYDAGYWSYYDDPSFGYAGLANAKYHIVHIIQMEALYALTKRALFRKYAVAWTRCAASPSSRLRYLVQYHRFSIRRRFFR